MSLPRRRPSGSRRVGRGCQRAALVLPLWRLAAARYKGDHDLRELADEARGRGLTGYDLVDAVDVWFGHDVPPFHGPLEVLDAIGVEDGVASEKDFAKAGLPLEHFKYFDTNKDGRFSQDEAMWWFMQRKPARTMNLEELANPPRGHLKKLGSWKDPLPNEGLIYTKPYPHPKDFWKKHMDGYLPALLKGAQHGWPCMNWTKEVLSERFGWVDAKLEPKVEGRSNRTAYKELDEISPRHRLNVSEYLRVEEGKNMYVVSILPQAMAWEVAHPSVLLCGSRKHLVDRTSKPPYKLTKHDYPQEKGHEWMTHIFELNLWIATGRTRSQFHYDKEWNVNCLLSGRKRWIFVNPFDYEKDIPWARGKNFNKEDPLNNRWTDWWYLNPDNVDLIVQHKLRNMDYYELIQEAGDCVFIPYAMLHQVEKLDEGLQVAASWMFLPETVYDDKACGRAPLMEDLPLASLDTLYMYTGKGIIPQGYNDPMYMVREMQDHMKQIKQTHLTEKYLKRMLSREDAILATHPDRKNRLKRIHKLLSSYAEDPSKGLRPDELFKVPLRIWCKPAAEGDPEGPLPCDGGEEYHFCDDEEFQRMEDVVQQHLAKSEAAGQFAGEVAPEMRTAPPRVWRPRAARGKAAGARQQEL